MYTYTPMYVYATSFYSVQFVIANPCVTIRCTDVHVHIHVHLLTLPASKYSKSLRSDHVTTVEDLCSLLSPPNFFF